MSRVNFFSLQADGTTDCGNIEDELLSLAVNFDHSAANHKVCVVNRLFSVRRLNSGSAKALLDCLKQAVKYMYVGLSNE